MCTRKPTESHQTLPSSCVILKAILAGVGWVWLARLNGSNNQGILQAYISPHPTTSPWPVATIDNDDAMIDDDDATIDDDDATIDDDDAIIYGIRYFHNT